MAAKQGGYWPTSWGWAALFFLWTTALTVILVPNLELTRLDVAAALAATGFCAWVVLSNLWTSSPTRTMLEAERTVLYVGALYAGLVLVRSSAYRALLAGTWGAIALVSAYSLSTRLLPERLGVVNPVAGDRLSEPIGYWNALGLFAAMGVLLAVGLVARARTRALRAFAAASMPVLAMTVYFTFSRGAWAALALGLAAMVVVDRRRVQLLTSLLVVSPWPAAAVAAASRFDSLTRPRASSIEATADDGLRVLGLVLVLAALAAVTTLIASVVERRVALPRHARAAYAAVLAVALVAGLGAAFSKYGAPPTLARAAYDAFKAPPPKTGPDPNQRLFNLSGTGRTAQWSVAWEQYRSHPWLGSGAGTYEIYWLQHRPLPGKVRDAHSLYLEVLAELGPVGLALLLAALGVPAVAAVKARRRSLTAAGFGAYVAFLAHAGIDWDWELAGVTLPALFCGVALLGAGRAKRAAARAARSLRQAALALALALGAFAVVGVVGNSAVLRAQEAANSGDWAEAEREARKAERWAPWSSEPWRLISAAQLATGRGKAGLLSLRTAIDKDRRDWRLWYELALASDGRLRREALRRATLLNPRSPEIASLRAALGREDD